MVKIGFKDNDPRILPEMSAKVAFLSRPVKKEEMKSRIAVNRNAVITRSSKNVAFLIKGDEAVETAVETGEQFGDMVEIANGLKSGDRIVIKPLEKMKNGTKIKLPSQ
jgi:FtsZ-interacting cell division protein YlmF